MKICKFYQQERGDPWVLWSLWSNMWQSHGPILVIETSRNATSLFSGNSGHEHCRNLRYWMPQFAIENAAICDTTEFYLFSGVREHEQKHHCRNMRKLRLWQSHGPILVIETSRNATSLFSGNSGHEQCVIALFAIALSAQCAIVLSAQCVNAPQSAELVPSLAQCNFICSVVTVNMNKMKSCSKRKKYTDFCDFCHQPWSVTITSIGFHPSWTISSWNRKKK